MTDRRANWMTDGGIGICVVDIQYSEYLRNFIDEMIKLFYIKLVIPAVPIMCLIKYEKSF